MVAVLLVTVHVVALLCVCHVVVVVVVTVVALLCVCDGAMGKWACGVVLGVALVWC